MSRSKVVPVYANVCRLADSITNHGPKVWVLATLRFMGAQDSKECLSNVDPKSKISEKLDQNCGS